jgi:hypothetical protein
MEELLKKLPLGLLIDLIIPLKNNHRREVQKEVDQLINIIDEIIKTKNGLK